MYDIDVYNSRTKIKIEIYFLGEINSWQIYQLKIKYGIENDSYGHYNYTIV